MSKKQVVLIVLDGWGYREETKNNAIAKAHKPFFDFLWNKYPHTLLAASGEAVGLPVGQMGNSEIGHRTIGAGSVIPNDLVRINDAIKNGEFDKNDAFKRLFDHVKKNNSVIHVEGLIGPGGVHSHMDHLYAFLKLAKKENIKKVAIHVFTDGRDTLLQSASVYIKELQNFVTELGVGFVATISGRYYAMDRDNNWDRTQKVEDALFECQGNICHLKDPSLLIEQLYEKNQGDELLEPIVCVDEAGQGCAIKENDGLFFFNFRPDRARMLSRKIVERSSKSNIYFVTMTEYEKSLSCDVAFPPLDVKVTLGGVISKNGLKQAHIAETEKYAHATYFLNGGREKAYPKETDILVPSRKDVKTHDEAPEMRAEEIAEKAVEEIEKGTDFVFINFANADMVGHTGNEPAIVKAIEVVDRSLEKIVSVLLGRKGIAFITADHGNAEITIDEASGSKHTAHSTNPAPAILTEDGVALRSGGGLADVAPTIFQLFEINKPNEMGGKSLIA